MDMAMINKVLSTVRGFGSNIYYFVKEILLFITIGVVFGYLYFEKSYFLLVKIIIYILKYFVKIEIMFLMREILALK